MCFQYVERIKSELIIAAKMLDYLSNIEEGELAGACKMYAFFLEALEGEINMAHNVVGTKDFEMAGIKVRDAVDKCNSNQSEDAMRLISEAISHVASSGQWAMQTLKDNNLL